MPQPPRDLDEQRIIRLLRQSYPDHNIRIIERPEWTAARFALQGGGGACVNVSKLATELRHGKPPMLIQAQMRSWRMV